MTLFVGVDVSGSFKHDYDNAMTLRAHYIYGPLHDLGGLAKPQALFVASIGGKKPGDPKSFHPIHDFEGKDIEQIATELRTWFPPSDTLTDFNSFFQEVARIAKERNRSEEHTSELQSLAYLVCRLLLEKKKNKD